MTAPREKKGSQPEYDDKRIVTFEVHHGEIYEYAKELDYHDLVVVIGIQNVAWRERDSIARNLTAEFEHEDESDEQSGYDGMYEEDEDDEEVVEEAINVEDKGDEEAINEEVEDDEEAENDKMVENKNEDSEEHEEDPKFYDRAYE
ncbi:acidic leucine-rich nuclear phosphoprotein 32 family member A-like [Prunus yedoensis var. nudiflora]|uniref:Acidic leucine-rich nuclear phosphoprotein 32 family member A-like n=1 Tax=Prunus yedoensis var. nudiflora TaxID=2094558 RepID=A0A314UYM0_PRUYE|nr:acidic leucine-rich nuclear phosphoprotein 32 family member A-like [Prunus yedoensis var. nudiflora]